MQANINALTLTEWTALVDQLCVEIAPTPAMVPPEMIGPWTPFWDLSRGRPAICYDHAGRLVQIMYLEARQRTWPGYLSRPIMREDPIWCTWPERCDFSTYRSQVFHLRRWCDGMDCAIYQEREEGT